jgi:hypothetical protein
MRFEPHRYDEERRATALRAFLATLLFSLIALWAFGGASVPAHALGGLDRQPIEQGAKLAAAANQRALPARLERAKARVHPAPDLSSPITFVEVRIDAAPMVSGTASWSPDAVTGSDAKAHHYSATGPPGRQLI